MMRWTSSSILIRRVPPETAGFLFLCKRKGSNLRPPEYQSGALPTELRLRVRTDQTDVLMCFGMLRTSKQYGNPYSCELGLFDSTRNLLTLPPAGESGCYTAGMRRRSTVDKIVQRYAKILRTYLKALQPRLEALRALPRETLILIGVALLIVVGVLVFFLVRDTSSPIIITDVPQLTLEVGQRAREAPKG